MPFLAHAAQKTGIVNNEEPEPQRARVARCCARPGARFTIGVGPSPRAAVSRSHAKVPSDRNPARSHELRICLAAVSLVRWLIEAFGQWLGRTIPVRIRKLLSWFPDDTACVDCLARVRWPEGFVCPACWKGEHWRTGRGLWMCQACERTSVTAETIFDRTRTPLPTWFAAAWFVTAHKNGISARDLRRLLGFGSYETAWLHTIRRAMVRPQPGPALGRGGGRRDLRRRYRPWHRSCW